MILFKLYVGTPHNVLQKTEYSVFWWFFFFFKKSRVLVEKPGSGSAPGVTHHNIIVYNLSRAVSRLKARVSRVSDETSGFFFIDDV